MAYQGCANYETWAVQLWMDNEEPSYRYWQQATREEYENAEPDSIVDKDQRARWNLAQRLKSEHEEQLPELDGFASDLLNAALSEVDWYEIAENLLEQMREAEALA